jgi:hypothetical protein
VVLDPLLVAPKPVAVVQDRHVPVGQARAVIKLVARERSQAVEMRLDMASERRGLGRSRAGPRASDPPGRS